MRRTVLTLLLALAASRTLSATPVPVVPEISGIPYDTTEPDAWDPWTSNVYLLDDGNYFYDYVFDSPDYCGECMAVNFWYSLGEARVEGYDVSGYWPPDAHPGTNPDNLPLGPPVLGILTVLFSIDGFDFETEEALPVYYFSRSMEVWVPSNPVPEPTTLTLLLVGTAGVFAKRRRDKRRH